MAHDQASIILLNFNDLTTDDLIPGSLSFNEGNEDIYLDLGFNSIKHGIPFEAFGGKVQSGHVNP